MNFSDWMILIGLVPFLGVLALLIFTILPPKPDGQRSTSPLRTTTAQEAKAAGVLPAAFGVRARNHHDTSGVSGPSCPVGGWGSGVHRRGDSSGDH